MKADPDAEAFDEEAQETEPRVVRPIVAIVGRPNVGKSIL